MAAWEKDMLTSTLGTGSDHGVTEDECVGLMSSSPADVRVGALPASA